MNIRFNNQKTFSFAAALTKLSVSTIGTLFISLVATNIAQPRDSAAFGASLFVIDQENPGPYETTNGSTAVFSFGQSFTPTLPAVDAFEFLLGGDNSTVVVQLRDGVAGADGLGGNIIAQSQPVLVDMFGSNFFHFDFPNRVSLVPNQVYVAELLITTGSLGVRHTQNDQYAGGQFLHQDFSPTTFSLTDLVFKEGLHDATVPEPSCHLIPN